MKLKVGTREDGTDYMLSARAIAMDISDKFSRSEPWLLLCDQGLDLEGDGTDPTGLRRPFAEVDDSSHEDSTHELSRFIRSIDRSAEGLAVVQADDTLSYPYLTAKRLLALCETDSHEPLPPIFAEVEAMLKAPSKPPVASVSYSWDDIQGWLDQRGSDPDVPFAGHVWTPEQQASVMERLQEYLEMHVYESFGRTLYVEALEAEWEKINEE